MAIKRRKPTNPASRNQEYSTFEEITAKRPHKPLTSGKKRIGGRNNQGEQTVWFRGGGHKRRYRHIDFRRDKLDVPAKVATVEYDPNRTARIALLHYADGEKRYILCPQGLQVGDQVRAGQDVEVNVGNALPLRRIPLGTLIHNIELTIGKGGQMVRSAGAAAQLMAKEGAYAQVRLPSGEVRKVHLDCYATVGAVGNSEHSNLSLGKAGRKRWLGRRPHNRGVTMNPVDHPMGGGEGRSSGGRHPTTPWGKPTKGYKTRRNKRTSNMIVRSRRKRK
ncbi:MAG: 50S ribosomal protein L2 [Acidobacteria bacterium]|nr:MAG: 50S ribosomal protein L2 [Acidobacteriota bacterium]REK07134.1 MAG: 50S ribosomal protein L2 [Acidobacteriota bacterium]